MVKDYYQILGVLRSATVEQLKKAFRTQALKYHPDRNPNDKEAEETFKTINHAFDVLNDPEQRRSYDLLGDGYNGNNGIGFSHEYPGVATKDAFLKVLKAERKQFLRSSLYCSCLMGWASLFVFASPFLLYRAVNYFVEGQYSLGVAHSLCAVLGLPTAIKFKQSWDKRVEFNKKSFTLEEQIEKLTHDFED